MSKITLEQVRDELHLVANNGCVTCTRKNIAEWADAIDAELKARGEPVAECPDGQFSSVVTWLKPLPPKGTKLYTAPPAPKIEVTDARVERASDVFGRMFNDHPYKECMRAALEAALKKTP